MLSEQPILAAMPPFEVFAESDVDDLLRRGLDWLERVAPYDVAAVLVVEGSDLVVRCARGRLANEAVRGHKIALSAFPTVREAIETRRARAFSEDDHAHGDGDPFDGVLDLAPGHSCMVVPLYAGNTTFGVMTLDRERCEPYAQAVVGLVEVYCQVLALAVHNAQRGSSLLRLHERDREHLRLLERELVGAAPLDYDEAGDSPMRRLISRARQVALADTPVLISGEEGCGKGRLARAVHDWSKRAREPFVAVDCASALDLARELFGDAQSRGRVGLARGGTLYLSNVHAVPRALQPRLRDVLADGSVRIVAATTLRVDELDSEASGGHFDRELYDRLSVFPLTLPALRDRECDLPRLCTALLDDIGRRTGRRGLTIDEEALAKLARYAWPGNVRELATVLERAAIVARDGVLSAKALDVSNGADGDSKALGSVEGLEVLAVRTLAEVQRQHIAAVLKLTGGRIYGQQGAAALLGVKPSTLQSKMKKLGLTREAAHAHD